MVCGCGSVVPEAISEKLRPVCTLFYDTMKCGVLIDCNINNYNYSEFHMRCSLCQTKRRIDLDFSRKKNIQVTGDQNKDVTL